eukprot:GILJ01005798.1.p1 GENE.GILJ01005798.1~~GILJ01005798.1.p1  ORF type:complete len:573 (-),score=71.94 GILJ01005798.1:158-1852(-)
MDAQQTAKTTNIVDLKGWESAVNDILQHGGSDEKKAARLKTLSTLSQSEQPTRPVLHLLDLMDYLKQEKEHKVSFLILDAVTEQLSFNAKVERPIQPSSSPNTSDISMSHASYYKSLKPQQTGILWFPPSKWPGKKVPAFKLRKLKRGEKDDENTLQDRIQELFDSVYKREKEVTSDRKMLKYINTRKKGYIKERAPDLTFVTAEECEAEIVTAVVLGEVKRNRLDGAAKGEIISCGQILRQMHPRDAITVFLLNDSHIIFFRLNNQGVTESLPLPLATQGWSLLLSLLCCDLKTLEFEGPPLIHYNGLRVPMTRQLGVGASSVVHEGSIQDEEGSMKEVVVKSSRHEHNLQQEFDILTYIHSAVTGENAAVLNRLPRVVHATSGYQDLILEPKGDNEHAAVRRNVVPIMTQLVETIKVCHQVGVCHRDLRPDNIITAGNNLLLIDFNYAVRNSDQNRDIYYGTLRFASDGVLEMLKTGKRLYNFQPADDLHSIVRACWAFLFQEGHSDLMKKNDFAEYQAFWREALQVGVWKEMETAAAQCDYVRLSSLIQNSIGSVYTPNYS